MRVDRRWGDAAVTVLARGALFLVFGLALVLGLTLLLRACPMLGSLERSTLLGSAWAPAQGSFGLRTFLAGSLAVTVLALGLSVPLCLLSALYLSEHASRRLRERVQPVLDVAAGVPSVVFGLFGVMFVVPGVAALGRLLGVPTTGYSLLAGGLVLALMAAPFTLSVALDVLLAVPMGLRETALAMGATRWETAWHVVLREARGGLLVAVVMGFARAFGETLAVMMVVGNVAVLPTSLFGPAYPLSALLANTYGEMMSIPRMEGALMSAALLLFLATGAVSCAATLVLRRMRRLG
ncbi:phosphate ABC transporter permease subunit PstC [Holophaga foetida]|uniref:phosphate ABC transporter permease subunit PstC n=1 Tax=Holophaga foetida TaxID=35839 RepID=UPI0002473AD7|nr:phosphate ABC transporter permease subunit PstC [Holophaga foetida]